MGLEPRDSCVITGIRERSRGRRWPAQTAPSQSGQQRSLRRRPGAADSPAWWPFLSPFLPPLPRVAHLPPFPLLLVGRPCGCRSLSRALSWAHTSPRPPAQRWSRDSRHGRGVGPPGGHELWPGPARWCHAKCPWSPGRHGVGPGWLCHHVSRHVGNATGVKRVLLPQRRRPRGCLSRENEPAGRLGRPALPPSCSPGARALPPPRPPAPGSQTHRPLSVPALGSPLGTGSRRGLLPPPRAPSAWAPRDQPRFAAATSSPGGPVRPRPLGGDAQAGPVGPLRGPRRQGSWLLPDAQLTA